MNTILTAIKLSTGLYGYKLGTTVIDKLSEQMATISRIANIIGVTVIAGLAATSVKIMVPITFAAGKLKQMPNKVSSVFRACLIRLLQLFYQPYLHF